MRVLVATTAGTGHFGPLVPVARACAEAGHEVVVAAPTSFADDVGRAGLAHAAFADVPPETLGPVFARLPELSREDANKVVVADVFGRLDARAALPGVTTLVREWRPDIVVREPCELGSLVAAAAAGVPQVQVSIGMSSSQAHMALLFTEPLDELARMEGLEPERAMEVLLGAPRLTSVPALLDEADPPEMRLDGVPQRGQLHRFRTDASPPSGELPPPWGDPAHPLVYVTFGSVTASLGPFGAVYPMALRSLADLPVRVLMTTGAGVDPSSLEPVPPNARVEAWWPQQDVMPHAAAVVGHGGFGTTMAALAAGVPQVVVPLFAHDQFVNAHHVAAVGAGVHLDGGVATEGLGAAVADLVATPAYREGAEAVADRMAELPPVTEMVTLLEDLAAPR
jgi:UDP:flavonoid glycosyltransferase YjiC (YdhE family)